MDRLALVVLVATAILQLGGCQAPLSLDTYELPKSKGYVSDELLESIKQDRLTPSQVKALLGEPAAADQDGKSMGYLQCARWSGKCLGAVFLVPVWTGECHEDQCRQVGIWFDDSGHAAETKSYEWDDRLERCSLTLWLSNRGSKDCYFMPNDFTAGGELTAAATEDLALIAPGDTGIGVASVAQGDMAVFQRTNDAYVDWHTMLRLDPGTYTVRYYAKSYGESFRTDSLALRAGHEYHVRADLCPGWSSKHGCSFMWSMVTGGMQAVFLWIEDVTTGEIVGGSKTEPSCAQTDPRFPRC